MFLFTTTDIVLFVIMLQFKNIIMYGTEEKSN